jgi:aminoglycoside/choline kinase family phosphotransferase
MTLKLRDIIAKINGYVKILSVLTILSYGYDVLMNSFSALTAWLTEHCQLTSYKIDPMPGDASFRRYYRVHCQAQSFIAMDAATEKQTCVPFVAIAQALRRCALQTPNIIASDFNQGFLLLSDFGQRLYLNELNSANATEHYTRALDVLSVIQQCREVDGWALKSFTAEFMRNELNLFVEWFLIQYWALELSDATRDMLTKCFDFLAESAASQPYVFMHRDYHSANLMILPNQQVGILDFQDAFIGPVTYDLVSLLRDCYIDWPNELVTEWVRYYWVALALPHVRFETFLRWFDLMGIQRHLKALLTFSRKYCRDNNANYLQHIPRTLNYVLTVSQRYPECQALYKFLHERMVEKCVE